MSDGPIRSRARGANVPEVVCAEREGTDRQLLHRFVARRDEGAFEALMARHGPMVYAVCRRVLRDAHEAEDACQATFLVLARKAGSLRRPELLANWLYGVAYRAARKAQRQVARHGAHAIQGAAMRSSDSRPDEVVWEDLRPVLDGELDRLPGKFRAPVVLCYLEGLTAEEAGHKLGCPRGTILSRLSRARAKLRKRLLRRGLALSAGLLGFLLAEYVTATEPLTVKFIRATARAARAFARGQPAAMKGIPGNSAALAAAILRGMFLAKIKNAALCLTGAGVILSVLVWSLLPGRAATNTGGGAVASGEPGQNLDKAGPAAPNGAKDDKELLQGKWQGTTIEVQGQALHAPPDPDKGFAFTFDGDNVKVDCNLMLDNFNRKFKLRLDNQAQPKRMDLLFIGDDGVVRENDGLVGIYELNGDTLRYCSGTPQDGRPTKFVAQGNHFVWNFKRGAANKPNEPPKQP
jgi:RNA polymerase sigma factor (sigma-70 family)